jgi:predicted nucleotide-binding protein (sugar kinase/HSP70/actin superfamily)
MAKRFKVKKQPPTPAQQFAFFREEVRKGMEPVPARHVERREAIVGSWQHQPEFKGSVKAEGTHILTQVEMENPGESLGRYGGTIADLWRWHNLGTRPHRILPRFKQALRFAVGGVIVFARYVLHPGTKAKRHTERINKSLQSFEEKQIRKAFRNSWKALQKFNKRK